MTDILRCCKAKPAPAKRAKAEEGDEKKPAKKIKVDEEKEEKPIKDEEDKPVVKLDLEEDESFAEVKEEDVKPIKEELSLAAAEEEESKDGMKAEE